MIAKLCLMLAEIHVNEGNYSEPDWFQPLMAVSDRYGFIIWPAVGLGVVGFVAWGVFRSVTHRSMPGEEKFKCKKEIIGELRRKLNGLTQEQIGQLIRHERDLTIELIDEMVKDNQLVKHINSKGATLYKLKGM
jgi:hypothetical protein